MSYLNRIALRILYIVVVVSSSSAIMGFLQVDSSSYMPYLYFSVAIIVLSTFLHSTGGELLLEA